MMVNTFSKYLKVMAIYLNREIMLQFNLPPCHLLKQENFNNYIAKLWVNKGTKPKEFKRKYKKKRGLKIKRLIIH